MYCHLPLLPVLTTLPHFLAVFMSPSPVYSCIVVASTSASIFWHLRREPRGWIMFMDYSLAYIWFIADIYYSIKADTFVYVTAMNAYIAALNYIALWLAKENILPYAYGHSIWHVLSVIKVLEVTLLLTPVPEDLFDRNLLRGSSYDMNVSYDYRSIFPI